MVSTTKAGRPKASTGSASIRCDSSRVASKTRITASGARPPAIRPRSTSRVTRWSMLRGDRPCTPGRSVTSTDPAGSAAVPVLCSTVTPG